MWGLSELTCGRLSELGLIRFEDGRMVDCLNLPAVGRSRKNGLRDFTDAKCGQNYPHPILLGIILRDFKVKTFGERVSLEVSDALR